LLEKSPLVLVVSHVKVLIGIEVIIVFIFFLFFIVLILVRVSKLLFDLGIELILLVLVGEDSLLADRGQGAT